MPQQLADHLDRYVLFLQGRGERVTDRVRGDRLTHTTSLRQRPQVAVKAQQGAVVFRIGRLTRFLPAQKREQVRRVLVRANRQLFQQEPYIGRDLHPDERPALLTVVRQDPVLDILFPQMGEIHERHPAEREHLVCGMVKDDHHRTRGLYYNNIEIPIDRDSEAFRLITRIQDEAHRFAIEYHRQLRGKGQVHSVLDDIPGIGSARRKALMRHFLSLDAIRDASVEELEKIPSMNQKAAESVYEFLH